MDGLSSATSIIAVIQLAGSIAKICGGYILEARNARDDIITLQRTVSGLEGVISRLKELLQDSRETNLPISTSLINNISNCLSRLQSLEEKIDPGRGKRMMKRLGIRALKWPLKRAEVDRIIQELERYKSSFTLSLQVDQTTVLKGLAQSAERFKQDFGLDKLPIARGAEYDSYMDQHEDECLPGTRVELLDQIKEWAVSLQEPCIFLLNGMAGTGKSTISRTTANFLKEANILGASFFFKRGEGDRGTSMKLFPTIARQLVIRIPQLIPDVQRALDDDPNIAGKSLKEQFGKLLLQPLLGLELIPHQTPLFVVVIDALDECESDEDMRIILQLLSQLRNVKPVRLRIFLTSRPEWPVLREFSKTSGLEHHNLVLHQVPIPVIERDISRFFNYRLSAIRTDRSLPAGWPGEPVMQSLVKLSAPLFIVAATTCRILEDTQWDPVDSLAGILAHRQDGSHFCGTYLPILNRLLKGQSKKQERKLVQEFQEVIGAIVMLESPLSVVSLSNLLGLPTGQIEWRLKSLHSVINIPADVTRPVRLFHLSFRDFLFDQETRDRTPFWVDEQHTHQMLTTRCLYVCDSLRKNMCRINLGTERAEVDHKIIDRCISPELQYSCRYWAHHLINSQVDEAALGNALSFLKKHFLHWVEAMSLLGLVSEVFGIISLLQSASNGSESHELAAFLHDARRFLLRNRKVADEAPLQIYCSGLIFAPKMAIVRRQFESERPTWIKMQSDALENWSAELQTLEGHSRPVASIDFSHDSCLLASCSDDQTVHLWDPVTGILKMTLNGHLGPVSSVAFSHNDRLLASGSDDLTVRLWDPSTGRLQQIFQGHSRGVRSVTFSQDGRILASGSDDQTIRLWNPATGALQQTLEGHSGSVSSVAFSHNDCLLASGSDDQTIRLWNPATGALQQTLEGHTGRISSVAFSCEGLLASASYDLTVRLWDPMTGLLQQTVQGHSRALRSVAFSKDGSLLASGSYDYTVRLWDLAAGAVQRSGESSSGLIFSVTFSGDGRQLASGCENGAVFLLDPSTGARKQILLGHTSEVRSVAFSQDGHLLASGSDDETVRLWDSATGALQQTLEGHSGRIRSIAFSHKGHLLASGSDDQTVRLWDSATGVLLHILDGHSSTVFTVTFSHDDQLLASGSFDRTIRLWSPATGALQQTLEGHSHGVRSVAFSHDDQILASGSYDLTVRFWDPVTGTMQKLVDTKRVVTHLEFSVGGTYLKTDLGYLDIRPSQVAHFPVIAEHEFHNFFVESQWVTFRGQKALWIPPEYRLDASTVKDNTLAWGHAPGSVSIIEFCL